MKYTLSKKRAVIIAVIAFVLAAGLTIVIDNARAHADGTGHQTVGMHRVKVTRTTFVRYRVATNGYRVRGATRVKAARLLSHRSLAFKKRMCREFGFDSPHQRVPTINVFCNKHVKAVTQNLAECGGQGAIAAIAVAMLGPVGSEVAMVAAMGGCEFSKTFVWFQKRSCQKGTNCAVRLAKP